MSHVVVYIFYNRNIYKHVPIRYDYDGTEQLKHSKRKG